MQANPRVELTAWKPGRGWVILRGRANLEDRASAEVREEGFKHMVALGEDWDDANDPRLTFFTIDDAAGVAVRHRRLLEPHRAVEVPPITLLTFGALCAEGPSMQYNRTHD